jgi:UDP:flavonoid glycosyltransferase YjiC (YdhE family)
MRILAIANAHALAHVSRVVEIGKVLAARGHVIEFAGFGKYLPVAARDGFVAHDLPYISVERVVAAVRSQRLWTLYPEAELDAFIAAELALYEAFKPDLVLLDNRPTARTSADMLGIRTAAVLNVHMSNHRLIPFFSYRQSAPWLPGVGAADRIENGIERGVYDRLVMGGLNALRRKHGLSRRYAYEHEQGDLSLFADLPEFNPVEEMPSNASFVGPLTWRNGLPEPRCLAALDPGRPTAYFSLGSEGLDELIAELGALADQGVQIVVATGTDEVRPVKPATGVFVEQYVNTDLLLPHCALVCCHGGNGTLYQALRHGLPCVVVSTHAEQHYGGKRLQELGLGRALTLRKVRADGIGALVNAVRDVLGSPAYQTKARAFARFFPEPDDPPIRSADLIEAFAPDRAA